MAWFRRTRSDAPSITLNVPDLPPSIAPYVEPSDLWIAYPERMLTALGLEPDPWQISFMKEEHRRTLLLTSRRSGKTTATAVKALCHAMFAPADKPATPGNTSCAALR
jgi:hypothetical protein